MRAPETSLDLEERVVGSVLGLALGDALGAPFEFRRASAIPTPLPAFELPWKDLPPGSTTDDTAMARNLVRSLAERGRFDPQDLVRRHGEWLRSDPPDFGNLTRRVLSRVAPGERAEHVAKHVWEERGPEVSAGNGSVMYCAPLGVAYANRSDELATLAQALSALTHFDERCGSACVAVTIAVAALVRGEDAPSAVASALGATAQLPGGEELEFLVDAVGRSRPIDGPDQGFCLFTAAAALQALSRGGSFEEELTRVVRLGGDTDTNAAVAGALLGGRDGIQGLPAPWLERLADQAGLEEEALALVQLAASA
jgi:ADP-ribosyl-[dinitrogen reductase] hydrolase